MQPPTSLMKQTLS